MSLSFTARPMQLEETSAIAEIEATIFPFPWTLVNFQDSLRSGYDGWVFEQQTQTLGYAVLMWVLDEVHLLNLSIVKQWQGQGFGALFLSWIIDHYRQRSARTILLEVRPSNPRAVALYQRFGFCEIGRRKNYYPAHQQTREDAIVMQFHV
jgi:[ribosomal protein S18]-alanine N-acetyltransferase